jgi:hypothetical protein
MTILPNGNVGVGNSRPSTTLDVNGNTTTQSLTTIGNIDCGGGIDLTRSNAFFFNIKNVDAGNRTNTYINLKTAGTENGDWC